MADQLPRESFTLSTHQCSVEGGARLTLNSTHPLPNEELQLVLRGAQETHKLSTERINATCLLATLPPHSVPETIELSLLTIKEKSPLFHTRFSYVMDQAQFVKELLKSVCECRPMHTYYLPQMSSVDALREFDQALVGTMRSVSLPPEWSLAGQPECSQEGTLLHFAVRHGLNSLSQYLLSLPGAPEAVLRPDKRGQLPIDVAHSQGNEGLAQLLTLYMDSNGMGEESPLNSPAHQTQRERTHARPAQDLEKFKEINSQWADQVKRFRHHSNNSLSSLDHPHNLTNGTRSHPPIRHIPVKRRRSSIAIMEVGNIPHVPATPIEAVQVNTRDPKLAVMERQRKTSWSKVVGSSECRSIDTGLNELDRISAEEAIQERLIQVKTELVRLDNAKQNPAHSDHLGLSGMHLGVMYRLSASCPLLNDDDEDDSDVPSAFLSTATSPGGRTDSPVSDPPHSPSAETFYQHSGSLPHVITTEYSDIQEMSRHPYSEPNLKKTVKLHGSSNRSSAISTGDPGPNSEESIVEHRQLNQSPTVRSEDSYVMVSSSASLDNTPEPELPQFDNTPVGTPSDTKNSPIKIPTPLGSLLRHKAHRRSLSSSEIEMSVVSAGTLTESVSASSSAGWKSPITSRSEESHLSTHESSTADLDERSRASSLVTNDTGSIHESGTSEEEIESVVQTGIKNSISLYEIGSIGPMKQELLEETSDSIQDSTTVLVRDANKRNRLRNSKAKRYSADFVSSFDDPEEDELKELKLRTNSTDVLDPIPDSNSPVPLTSKLTPDTMLQATSDLSPSEIELSFKSGDNSLENSQNGLFFTATGSPKTIKKRKNKSPLLSRRSTIAHTKQEDPRGLSKDKVTPTISALKHLMKPASDSDENEQPMDNTFESSHTEGTPLNCTYIEDRPRSVTSPRNPQTPPPGVNESEFSSLDFIPSSPHVRDKNKKMFPSPLTVEKSKQDKENVSNGSSPTPNIEEAVRKPVGIVESSGKASFVNSDSFIREVRFSNQDISTVQPNQDEPHTNKERRWKLFGQKSGRKSLNKDNSKSQDSETESAKISRSRSTRRHKYEDVVLKYVTPREYEQEGTPPLPSPSVIGRSTSLLVGMDHVGEEQTPPPSFHHNRSTSVQFNDPPKLILLKQQSEVPLNYPTSKQEGLSPLEEVPSDSNNSSPRLAANLPHVGPPSGDSENEQEEIVRSLSVSHPVLEIQEEFSWDKTVDRRLYKKLNKAERERQAILHELVATEQNHFRALHVLKLVFRQQMTKVASEENIIRLFPELDNLIDISDGFLKKLKSRKSEGDDIIINDLSDVLLEQFTGDNREQMLHSFGVFCSGHLNAMEIFKEHMKKKSFSRLMKQLNSLKECQRLTLPDYYLGISQRLSKLVTLVKRLAKKSESLKLEHAPRVRESLQKLEELITAVDTMVADNKMRMEVEDIQSRLEVPRSTKYKERQERLNFSLIAQGRKLRKRGMAEWIGHGKEATVHVILMTDMVVLLTERDQRYHLASLLDHKAPVIRLYDLHVRVNVSVKTGVQLLLLEKGDAEMFRLEFSSKKLAREWEVALNGAVDECKEQGLKCEYFGAEKVVSEEGRKEEEDRIEESDLEDSTDLSLPQPFVKNMQRARESLALATKLLNSYSTTTTDSSRTHGVATTTQLSRTPSHEVPRNRNRSQTVQRPKTAFFNEEEAGAGSTTTMMGDHVITSPMPLPEKAAKVKAEKKKVKLDRSSTFRGKDKEKEKGVKEEGSSKVVEQYIRCIMNLKESLQEIMNLYEDNRQLCEEKDMEITKLRNELAVTLELQEQQQSSPQTSLAVSHRLSPRTSPPQPRPHSVHFDHNHEPGTFHSQSEYLLRDKDDSSDDETPNGSQLALNED